jgi:hypothetical protein
MLDWLSPVRRSHRWPVTALQRQNVPRYAKNFGCEFVGDRTDIRKLAVQCCLLWARLNDRSAPVAGLI